MNYMKKINLILILIVSFINLNAQNMNDSDKRLQIIENKIAIKNLVDTFSVLADVKDIKNQVLLFTPNAIVQSERGGKITSEFKGREEIGKAFSNFLNLFEVVYHINGQQTVDLDGDKASGISYCTVTLIGNENGKKMKTTMGVIYHDEYVWEKGSWLISKRQSNFTWTQKTEQI